MSFAGFRRVVPWAACLPLLSGCGARVDSAAASGGPESDGGAPVVVATEGLPELGDYLPPLDGERLEVAPPKGWLVPPRDARYVLRLRKSDRLNYPSMIITAEDDPGEAISDVSADNVQRFADQLAASLKKDRSGVRPIRIGGFVGAAYRKRGRVRAPVSKILELTCIETVVAGRRYHVELRSEEGSLEKDQPYLLAVAGGIRFPKGRLEQPAGSAEEKAKEEPQEPGEARAPAEKRVPNKPLKKSGDLGIDLDKLDELLKED